jgi:beta-fructofuranosidase
MLPYIWDSWYRYDHETKLFHVYYLNVDDHSLVIPEQHHFHAKLGYATTYDFINYDYINHNILSADSNTYDDTSIWTGCVVQFGEQAQKLMAFTSRNSKQERIKGWEAQAFNQHISFAISNDNITFERIANKHLLPDERFYNIASIVDDVTIHAWRDPFIFRNPYDDYAYMLVTAQARGLIAGIKDKRAGLHGVIALLRADEPKKLSGWSATGISFVVEASEAEVPRLYYDANAQSHLIAYSRKNDSAYLGDKANQQYGFYGFHVDLKLLSLIAEHKQTNQPHLIHIPHSTQIPLLGFGEDNLYACQIIPELEGKIMGFDTRSSEDGGGKLRLSNMKQLPHLQPANLNFDDFIL